MHEHITSFAVVLTVLCAATSAHAQTPYWSSTPLPSAAPAHEEEGPGQPPNELEAEAPEPPYDTRYYGYQILLVDVASLLVMGYETEQGSDVGGYLGTGGLYLGGPLVHLANGQGQKALASGGLRVGLTLGGFLLGGGATGGQDGVLIGILGGMVGLTTAAIIDWTVLGKKKVPREGYSLTPTASVGPQGVNVGVVGRF